MTFPEKETDFMVADGFPLEYRRFMLLKIGHSQHWSSMSIFPENSRLAGLNS